MKERRAPTPKACPKCHKVFKHLGRHVQFCEGSSAGPPKVLATTNGHSVVEMCEMFEVQLPIFFKNVKMLVEDLKAKNEVLAPFIELTEKLKSDKLQKMFDE